MREVEERQPGFSARFDAQWREYHYHACLAEVPPLFMRDFSWYVHGQLDIDAMREAAAYLVGEHDFKSFCMAASAVGKPTCRNVHEISLSREMIMGEDILTIKVVGNAFLHSMVRTIVGTLVMVGRGQRKPGMGLVRCLKRAIALRQERMPRQLAWCSGGCSINEWTARARPQTRRAG